MNIPPAFQFYPDDFLGGVSDMTQGEVGAYILLLCQQWNRGSIPVQPDRQKLLAKGDVTDHVLAKFRENEDGLLRNERLEKERNKQTQYRESQRVKGQRSGVARRTTVEPRLNPGSVPVGTGRQPETNSPSPSPSPRSTEERLRTPVEPRLNPSSNAAEIPTWETFWSYCQMHELPAEWFARDKFLAAQVENWATKSNWRAYAERCAGWWRDSGCHMRPPAPKSASAGHDRKVPPKPHVDCYFSKEEWRWIDLP